MNETGKDKDQMPSAASPSVCPPWLYAMKESSADMKSIVSIEPTFRNSGEGNGNVISPPTTATHYD